MNRFAGIVGYGESQEIPEGSSITVHVVTEHPAFGDVIRKVQRANYGDTVNGKLTAGHSISIVADEHASQNYAKIKYVLWGGQRWTVNTITVQSPRLILELGEVWNGEIPEEDP